MVKYKLIYSNHNINLKEKEYILNNISLENTQYIIKNVLY